MSKFSEIFVEPNVAYECVISEIKPDVVSKFGVQTVVKVNYSGADFDWWLKPEQFERLFCNEGKQEIFAGDTVEITQNPPTGKIKFAFYTMEKVSEGSGSRVATPRSSTPAKATPSTAPVRDNTALIEAQKKEQATRQMNEELKDRRISIAGYTQALITRGMPVDEAKLVGLELAKWSRTTAYSWYQEELASEVFDA